MPQMNCPPISMQYVLLSSNQQALPLTPFQSACSMFSCPPIIMHTLFIAFAVVFSGNNWVNFILEDLTSKLNHEATE